MVGYAALLSPWTAWSAWQFSTLHCGLLHNGRLSVAVPLFEAPGAFGTQHVASASIRPAYFHLELLACCLPLCELSTTSIADGFLLHAYIAQLLAASLLLLVAVYLSKASLHAASGVGIPTMSHSHLNPDRVVLIECQLSKGFQRRSRRWQLTAHALMPCNIACLVRFDFLVTYFCHARPVNGTRS